MLNNYLYDFLSHICYKIKKLNVKIKYIILKMVNKGS